MHYSTISLLTLLSTASATPIHSRQDTVPGIPAAWSWHISSYEAGCSRSGCVYDFHVSIPPLPTGSESTTGNQTGTEYYYCPGQENNSNGVANSYQECQKGGDAAGEIDSVKAKFGPRVEGQAEGPAEFFVSCTLGGANFTAKATAEYNQAVAGPLNFDIKPTQVFRVA